MSTSVSATTLRSTRDFPITADIHNASYATPATIPLAATPAAGTTITRIEVYAGLTLIASNSNSANSSILNTTWITLKPGTQTLTARAIDSNGGISTASVTITVTSAANETITFIHNDLAGSPMAATDINGAIVWKEDYSPYGERKQNEAAASNQHQWFGGKVADSETGLSYFGARYYDQRKSLWGDPVVGRFMGVDAVGFNPGNLQSFNRYAYANNNPYKFVDPSGNSALSLVDWYDFGKDVGGLWIDIGIYTAASVLGNKDVQYLAWQGMDAGVGAAALSTAGIINPVPGTSRMVKTEIQAVEIGSKIEKQVGSYTHTFENGMKYHGKGTEARAATTAAEKAAENTTKAVGTDFKAAANNREAFKDESRRLNADKGGAASDKNYNKIDSPGTKYIKQDGQ